MLRHLFILLIVIGSWILLPAAAFACSCGKCDETTSFLESELHDFVGGGMVTSITLSEDRHERIVEIQVLEELRGNGEPKITVRTPTSGVACGAYFSVGSTIRIAAFLSDGVYRTGVCSQRCWRSDANKDLLQQAFDDEQDYPFAICGR